MTFLRVLALLFALLFTVGGYLKFALIGWSTLVYVATHAMALWAFALWPRKTYSLAWVRELMQFLAIAGIVSAFAFIALEFSHAPQPPYLQAIVRTTLAGLFIVMYREIMQCKPSKP